MTTDLEFNGGWRRVRFGDVVREVKIATKDPAAEGLTRVVGLEHLDSESLPLRRWNELSDLGDGTSFTRVFRAGQVLFGKRRAYQRKVAVADFDGICSSDILVFEPSVDDLLPEFLPYVVQSDGFFDHALGTSAGSLSPRTKFRELAKYEFGLPSLEDQERIVEVLDATAGTIGSYEAVSSVLGTQRDAAASAIWELSRDERELSALASVTVGIVVKPAALYVESGGVPALRSLNVLPGRVLEDDLVQISVEAHAAHKKSQLSGGDVVVVRTGRPGDAAVVPRDGADRNAIDLLIVRCGPDLRPEYLACFLNSTRGRSQMLGRSAGTAQQHLNAGQLSQVRIPVPNAEAQDQIVRLVEASGDLDAQVASARHRLASAGRSLRERLLDGAAP